jgi:hypothetical protein
MKTGEIIREEAGKFGLTLEDDDVEYVLWEHTGFPEFWHIPEDGATPEECLRKQVRDWAQRVLERRRARTGLQRPSIL